MTDQPTTDKEAVPGVPASTSLVLPSQALPEILYIMPVTTRPFMPAQIQPMMADATRLGRHGAARRENRAQGDGPVLRRHRRRHFDQVRGHPAGRLCRAPAECLGRRQARAVRRAGRGARAHQALDQPHAAVRGAGRVPEGRAGAQRRDARLGDGAGRRDQGADAAQPALQRGPEALPDALQPRGSLAAHGLRRDAHQRRRARAAGGAGNTAGGGAHAHGAAAAEEGDRGRAAAGPHQHPGERDGQRAPARVLPARAAEGHQAGAGAVEGRPQRRRRAVRGAPRQSQGARARDGAHPRRARQARDPRDRLARVRRDAQLPRLGHLGAVGRAFRGQARSRARARRAGARARRPGGREGSHPRVHRGRCVQGRDQRLDHPAGRPAGRGQDLDRKIHRARAGARVLSLQPGRHARRGRDQGPPPHLHRRHARQVRAGAEAGEGRQPRDHARRDRQGRRLVPGRSGIRAARGARPGTERGVSRPLPRSARGSLEGAVRVHREPARHHSGAAAGPHGSDPPRRLHRRGEARDREESPVAAAAGARRREAACACASATPRCAT